MSYTESDLVCDYCKNAVDGAESVACSGCYEDIERELATAKEELARAEKAVGDLEDEIFRLRQAAKEKP